MKVIDVHAHVFEALKGFNGKGEMVALGGGMGRWATGEECRMIPPGLGDDAFTYETCLKVMDENGVDKAVLLQGNYYGFQNEYVKKAVEAHPDRFVGAGIYDPLSLFAEKLYDRVTFDFGFKILKFECSSGCGLTSVHGPFSLRDVFMPVADKCEANGQVLVLDLGSPGMESFQPEAVREIAATHPSLKIVICHLLAPQIGDREPLKKALDTLAADNIWFDLAAVPFNVNPETFPYPTGLAFISDAKAIAGADKLMWGTDIPSVLWYDSYANLRDYLLESDVLTESEKKQVFYETALSVFPFN